jgi:hypothetical protein
VSYDLWREDIASLEAITQHDGARELVLHMAASAEAPLPGSAPALADEDLDPATREALADLASDRSFLLAVEDYVHRTARAH